MAMKQTIHHKQGVVVVTIENNGFVGKGKSRCNVSEGDTFDEKTGLELAEKRARVSIIKAKKQFIIEEAKMIEQKIQRLQHELEKREKLIVKKNDRISVLTNEIEEIVNK